MYNMKCPSCGSTSKDRVESGSRENTSLWECQYCGSLKCCMCDMGDDVECPSCEIEEDE